MKKGTKPKYLTLCIAVALALVVLIAFAAIPRTNIDKAIESPFSVALALETPSFASAMNISENETEEATLAATYAFPSDKAGISAYVNVNETINVTDPKILDIFSSLSELSNTHVIGVVPIDNTGKTVNVNVYADINGWLVV